MDLERSPMDPERSPMDPERSMWDQGRQDIRRWLHHWWQHPGEALGRWVPLSLGIALLLLLAALAVATASSPEGGYKPLGVDQPGDWSDALDVLRANLVVLLLHTLVCWAAFMARRTLPASLHLRRGADRWVHQHAGPAALVAVAGATLFSLITQAWILGHILADEALSCGLSPALLLAVLAVHGLPELAAVFLPLAACLRIGQQRQWDQLGAATLFSAGCALPVILTCCLVEVYLTPRLLLALL